MHEGKKKRNRHARTDRADELFYPTQNELDLLATVYKFRILSQDQLATLFYNSRSNAQVRLAKLFDHKFLDRKFLKVGLGEGRSPTFYVLDRRGIEVLRTERGFDEFKRWYESSKFIKDRYIVHTVGINSVMVAAKRACDEHGYTLLDWITENEVKADYDHAEAKNLFTQKPERIPIAPDSVFTVIAKGGKNRFQLEIDTGEEGLETYRKKIRGYIAHLESGLYERRYGTTAGRILTVVTTKWSGEQRLANLKRVTEAEGGGNRFWFTTLPKLNYQSIYDEPIWYVAKSDEPRTLI